MLHYLPDDLRYEQELNEVLHNCFPEGQVRKILPVPIQNRKLWWADFNFRRHIRKEQRMLRHCEKYENILMILSTQTQTWWVRMYVKWNKRKLKLNSGVMTKRINKVKMWRKKILNQVARERIDVEYIKQVDQIYPCYPASTTSHKYLNKTEPEGVNLI